MKLTGWYTGDQEPESDLEHIGVYERDEVWCINSMYSKWDGENWLFGAYSADEAAKMSDHNISNYQYLHWRGIVK